MVGLFSRAPKDPEKKENAKKIKQMKKFVKEKKYVQALNIGTEYVRKSPNNPDVLFMIGGIHYLENKYRTAISYFDRSLKIASYDVDVLLLKAYSHQKLGENKQALRCCNKIKEVDPKNKSVSQLLAEINP